MQLHESFIIDVANLVITQCEVYLYMYHCGSIMM